MLLVYFHVQIIIGTSFIAIMLIIPNYPNGGILAQIGIFMDLARKHKSSKAIFSSSSLRHIVNDVLTNFV